MQDERDDIEKVLGLGENATPFWRSWRMAGLAAAVVVVAALGYSLWGGDGARGVRYVTEPVTRGGLTVTVTATGAVAPTNEVEISSELSGMIRSVLVDFNDAVAKGQVLAELDTDKLEAQVKHTRALLDARKAKLTELEATLNEKRREYERVEALAEKGHSSESALDVARAAFDRAAAAIISAKADIAVAEADLFVDETNLKKACICSPIDGVVLQRNVDPGQTVASSFQTPVLFTLADDLREMQLEVDIDEADIGKVREGNRARFTVEAYDDREFPAAISELRFAPETVEGVVTYKAVLTIDNRDLLLRPGMTATAEITVQEVEDALLIPNAALRFAPPTGAGPEDGLSLIQSILPRPPRTVEVPKLPQPINGAQPIWVLRGEAPVEVGVRIGASDGIHSEVLEGDLEPGDRVIVDSVEPAT